MLNSFCLSNITDEFEGLLLLPLAVTISKFENDIQEGSPKERMSPEASPAPSRSQSPRASPRLVASAPATPEEPQAGPSSQSEPQRVNMRHYAWQYE